MIPSRVVEAKRDGVSIPSAELEAFLRAYLDGAVEEYQMSAFLMATYFKGLDADETATLVKALLSSGSTADLSVIEGPRVDKHSTGGVGDKVSLVLAPLAAACGLFVPMMSGRGLGHTTGTLDKLEAIPGFQTRLPLKTFRSVLQRVGCAMIGQTEEIAPLDRRLYALRDVTGTVPVIPLIAASIMSKKLAEDLDGLVLDVKTGSGAFIPEEPRALSLARTMVGIGQRHGLPTVALLTAMDRPLGSAVGNGLETAEAIRCLRGEGPQDLADLVVREVAEMLRISGVVSEEEVALARARHGLDSGAALERFRMLVREQGGDASMVDHPDRLLGAPIQHAIRATRAGTVVAIEPRPLGEGVVLLGGGRRTMGSEIDLDVGFVLDVRPGSVVDVGDVIGVVHARDEDGAATGRRMLLSAVEIGSGVPELLPLVSHRLTAADL